jgi:hypothetical protein
MIVLLAMGFPNFTFPGLENSRSGISFVSLAVLSAFFFLLPSMIAVYRKQHHYLILLALNLLLGWNLIAWFAILLYAVYGRTQAQVKAKSIARQRLLTALSENLAMSGDPALSEEMLLASYRHHSESNQLALRRDPRGPVAVLVGVAAVLAFVVAGGFSNPLTNSSPGIKIINAVATSPDAQLPDELESRATFQDILNACGQPERRWTTSSGQGTSLQTVDHLFYSRVPAEIRLAIRPNENREQSRHWTFAGAALSPDSTSTYSGEQLKERMPCMAQWADALAARESLNLKDNVH